MAMPDTKFSDTIVISNISPLIEGGKYPVKRVVGESIRIEADIFKDGHDKISANLLWRNTANSNWQKVPMSPVENDRWTANAPLSTEGLTNLASLRGRTILKHG